MRCALLMLGAALLVGTAQAQPRPAGVPVPFGPEGLLHAHVSPSGDAVLLTTEAYAGLWVATPQGDVLRQLSDAPGIGFGTAFSPDGSHVAARAARVQPGGARFNQLVLLNVATGAETALTEPRVLMPALPQFSPDGARVLIATENGPEARDTGLAPVPSSRATTVFGLDGAWTARNGAAAKFRLPVDGAQVLRAVPSPDGSRIALELYGGDLYVTDADGSNAVSLGRGEAPTWRPDGAYVAFMVTRDDGHELLGSDLMVASADGQRRAALTRTEGVFEMNPAWLTNDALLFDDLTSGRVLRLPLTDN